MIRLNRKFLLIAMLVAPHPAFAGEVILFQQPHLLAFVKNDQVTGVYSRLGKNGSCYFMFYGIFDKKYPDKAGYPTFKINTFLGGDKLFDFLNRDKDCDIDGFLYKSGDRWVIRTTTPQAGCSSAQGIFSADPPNISASEFFIVNEIPAVGIRLVANKAFLRELKDNEFVVKKSYLLGGDAVVVLKVRGEFSYIRYVDTGPKFDGRVTFGWLRTNVLVDPFPSK
nr:hypothetical protein HUO10_000355 [Paraburkholderia busanensis]